MLTPLQGASDSSVLEMISSWKVKDLDPFCHDSCGGKCPHCSENQKRHYLGPKLCGLLNKPDGPFAICHKTINPEMYSANCVYDVCTNQGEMMSSDGSYRMLSADGDILLIMLLRTIVLLE